MEWMRDFVEMSRFDRNWSPVSFDQLEWRRWGDCELTDAIGVSLRDRKLTEEIVEGIGVVFENAVSD